MTLNVYAFQEGDEWGAVVLKDQIVVYSTQVTFTNPNHAIELAKAWCGLKFGKARFDGKLE